MAPNDIVPAVTDTAPGEAVAPPASSNTSLPKDAPWPSPIAIGSRILLRPYHPSDASHVSRLANNKKITVNMSNRFPDPYTLEEAESWVARCMDPEGSGIISFVIGLVDEPKTLVGTCGWEPGSDVLERNALIGYFVGEEYWGKGYASEMVRLLTDWAFEQSKGVTGKGESLIRVGAEVYGGNEGSKKCLLKNGWRFEGCLRGIAWKWGEVRDLENYGLMRSEWEELKKARS
jgi:RimJ/RimL family protein N-acetyltransferase